MIRVLPILVGLLACIAGPLRAECGTTGLDLAGPDVAAIDARVAETPYGVGLLWEARRGDDRLTIVGTLHIGDDRHRPMIDRLTPVIAEADLLMVEITRADEAVMLERIVTEPGLMYITDGPTLPELLTEEDWQRVTEAAARRQIPGFLAAKLRPWALMVTLAIPPCAAANLTEGAGLDHWLMAVADAYGTRQESLEPPDTLMRLFDAAGQEAELDLLRASLVSDDLLQRMHVSTLESYFAGQTARIMLLNEFAAIEVEALTEEEEAEALAMMTSMLLDRRNLAWLPVIEAAAERHDDIVVAAGAGHLPGELGILNLLEQSGWSIRRLN